MKNILSLFIILFTLQTKAQEIDFGKVSKEELEENFYPLDSTADAAYLLKKRRTYFQYDTNDGFVVVTEYHERIKIYTKEGFNYATKKITYYKPESGDAERVSSMKAYTFNIENGKIIDEKVSKKDIFDEQLNKYRSQKKITFPNIKEGSVIDLKYTLTSPYWNIKPLNFQYGIPVKQLDYEVETPEYFTFSKTSKGYYHITPRESKKNKSITFNSKSRSGWNVSKTTFHSSKVDYTSNISTFLNNNIPAIKDNEPYSGNINNYRGGLEFELSGTNFIKVGGNYKNYATNWEDVCKTIYKSSSFGNELDKTNYYKDELTTILNSAKNDYEKTASIFQFVKSKIKWNGYNAKYTEDGVKKAYKERVGNAAEINLTLTSMLRSAGLNANPVLISTKDHGIPLFPTLDGFNYVTTKVNFTDGTYILLDATEKYSFPNILPYRTLNWYGREVLKDGSSQQVKLIPSNHAKENYILHVKLDESGTVEGMLRKTFSDHNAMFYRQRNNVKKEEDVITGLEEKYTIEIDEFKVLNSEDISKPIVQNIKFNGEDFIEEINDKLYFSPLFFLATKENPFKAKERNFPIDFSLPWQDQFSVSITIPEGYTVESFPEELAIGLPENIGIFKYKIITQGNKIKLNSIIQFNTAIIPPHYYESVKDFYKQLVEKQTEKIVLVKK